MKNKFLVLSVFLILFGCATPPPVGKVVTVTGSDMFHVEYIGKDLKVGDRVKIMMQENKYVGEGTPPVTKRKIIGEGKVSSILNGNFYEIKTETAQHIPSDAIIEKY